MTGIDCLTNIATTAKSEFHESTFNSCLVRAKTAQQNQIILPAPPNASIRKQTRSLSSLMNEDDSDDTN